MWAVANCGCLANFWPCAYLQAPAGNSIFSVLAYSTALSNSLEDYSLRAKLSRVMRLILGGQGTGQYSGTSWGHFSTSPIIHDNALVLCRRPHPLQVVWALACNVGVWHQNSDMPMATHHTHSLNCTQASQQFFSHTLNNMGRSGLGWCTFYSAMGFVPSLVANNISHEWL